IFSCAICRRLRTTRAGREMNPCGFLRLGPAALRAAGKHALLLALLGVLAAPRRAAPRDELLRLVPEVVGFCLLMQDLRGHVAAVQQSPFMQRLRATPYGEALRNQPAFGKLKEIDAALKQHLGLDAARVRDELLGDAVVFAYRPGP